MGWLGKLNAWFFGAEEREEEWFRRHQQEALDSSAKVLEDAGVRPPLNLPIGPGAAKPSGASDAARMYDGLREFSRGLREMSRDLRVVSDAAPKPTTHCDDFSVEMTGPAGREIVPWGDVRAALGRGMTFIDPKHWDLHASKEQARQIVAAAKQREEDARRAKAEEEAAAARAARREEIMRRWSSDDHRRLARFLIRLSDLCREFGARLGQGHDEYEDGSAWASIGEVSEGVVVHPSGVVEFDHIYSPTMQQLREIAAQPLDDPEANDRLAILPIAKDSHGRISVAPVPAYDIRPGDVLRVAGGAVRHVIQTVPMNSTDVAVVYATSDGAVRMDTPARWDEWARCARVVCRGRPEIRGLLLEAEEPARDRAVAREMALAAAAKATRLPTSEIRGRLSKALDEFADSYTGKPGLTAAAARWAIDRFMPVREEAET